LRRRAPRRADLMFRPILVGSITFFAAHAAVAQCDPAVFDNTCAGNVLTACFNDGAGGTVEESQDCTFPDEDTGEPIAPNAECGLIDCNDTTGEGACALFDDTCLSGADDPCIGISPRLDDNAANDANAFGATCVAGSACTVQADATGALTETCLESPGGFVCEAPLTYGCADATTLILCLGISEDADGDGVLDPGEDSDADGAIDVGVTTSPFAIACTGFFDGCDDEAPDGPMHQSGIGQPGNSPDCLIAAEGEGEGEGEEGEGEEGEGEGDRDDEEPEPPPTGCGSQTPNPALWAFALLLGALVLRRRRG
jgi:uncharacterized protein (TIGR03382 family)